MPKVSVIVPIYNVEKFIEKCARSLFEQTLDDIEYIFVNDCTPDNSIQVLEKVLQEYPKRLDQVRMLNHAVNMGQSGARRDGMAAASGDYIIHCDADDWVDIDMYETMYQKALESGSDSVSCDMVLEFAGHSKVFKYNNLYADHRLMYGCAAPISVEYCSMCNRLISRAIFENYIVEPFEGVNMWDDVGLSIRLRYYCENNVVINKAFYHYNKQNEVSTTRRPVLDRVKEQLECARQIELFFAKEKMHRKYYRFVMLVKLVSKLDLFYHDVALWRRTFPEANRYLYLLSSQCNCKTILKLYLYAYCERFMRLAVKFKNRYKR